MRERDRYIYIYIHAYWNHWAFSESWCPEPRPGKASCTCQFLIQMCTSTSLPQSSQFSNLGSSFHPAFKLGILWRRMAPGCWHFAAHHFLRWAVFEAPVIPCWLEYVVTLSDPVYWGLSQSSNPAWEIYGKSHEPTSEFGETKGLSQSLFERFEVTKTNPNSAELRGRPNVLALLYWDKKGLREQAMTARFL